MLSIIITAYQEPKTLDKQLQNLIRQISKMNTPSEILVCAPDYPTQRVVSEYQKEHSNVKLIQDRGVGKPAALNLAFGKARGDIWVLTDGDVLLDRKAIFPLLKPFKNPRIGAVTGRPVPLDSRRNMLGYWAHFLTLMAHQTRLKRMRRSEQIDCSGYLYALRGNLIKKIPKNALADDAFISHLVASQGYQITYTPKAKVFVKYPASFSDWIKQKKRSTGGYVQLALLQKNSPPARGGVGPARHCFASGEAGGGGGRKGKMRSFSKEMQGIWQAFQFAQNIREYWWTILLIFARIYLWFLIFWEIKIIKKPFDQIWQRVESTK